MVHNHGESFRKHSQFLHDVSDRIVPPLIEAMKMGSNENIFQHESRDGSFTHRFLVRVVEKTNGTIYSLERSKSMVEYAQENCSHGKIVHVYKDILDEDLHLSFGEDKIQKLFSLYVLQWVSDYKAVLKKMYQILEPDGKACLVFASKVDLFFRFAKHIRKDPEWSWLGLKLAIPDWVEADFRGEEYLSIIKDSVTSAGFTIEKFEIQNEAHTMNTKEHWAGNYIAECF